MRKEVLCNLKIPPDKTVMKQIEIMCHLIACNIILVTFLPKAHNLMRKYQLSRLRDIIQNNWFIIFKRVKFIWVKERLIYYYSSRRLARQLNVTCYPELDPFAFLEPLSNLNRANVLVESNESMLTFWLWWWCCGYVLACSSYWLKF